MWLCEKVWYEILLYRTWITVINEINYLVHSVCSNCTDICLDRCDRKLSGSCEVCRVERGAVLYCTARGRTVCFTLDRMLSGPRRCLDAKGKKISALHTVRTLLIGWTFQKSIIFTEKEKIIRKADSDKLIYLGMSHLVILLPNTMRTGFDPKIIEVGFVVDEVALGQVCSEKYEFRCKCCLNIHETNINAVQFSKFRISL
jgi:hypothetical protein